MVADGNPTDTTDTEPAASPSTPVEPDPAEGSAVCVFAPMLHLTVTIELGEQTADGSADRPNGVQSASKEGDGADEIHIHPGGQGIWIAQMLTALGHRPVLCGAVGGEIGTVLRDLVPAWGIDTALVDVATRSPGYVQDRRSGERVTVGDQAARGLDRHESDDLYGKILETAMASGALVLTSAPTVPRSLYERLGADLASAGVRVFGDLHGEGLSAFLSGGPIELLKVSHEDLADDGWDVDDDDAVEEAIERLQEMGVVDVVVSRADLPAMASLGGITYLAKPPALEVVDHLGAGDSMTAGLVAARLRNLSDDETLRLGCAAGAANITRHGLGSGSPELITALTAQVEVATLHPDESGTS